MARLGGKGCDYSRDPEDLARRAGLTLTAAPLPLGPLGLFRLIVAAP